MAIFTDLSIWLILAFCVVLLYFLKRHWDKEESLINNLKLKNNNVDNHKAYFILECYKIEYGKLPVKNELKDIIKLMDDNPIMKGSLAHVLKLEDASLKEVETAIQKEKDYQDKMKSIIFNHEELNKTFDFKYNVSKFISSDFSIEDERKKLKVSELRLKVFKNIRQEKEKT